MVENKEKPLIDRLLEAWDEKLKKEGIERNQH